MRGVGGKGLVTHLSLRHTRPTMAWNWLKQKQWDPAEVSVMTGSVGRELPGPRECGNSALLALQLHSPWTHSQPWGVHSLSEKRAEVLLGEAHLSRAGEEGFSEEVTPLQSPKDELAGSKGLESPRSTTTHALPGDGLRHRRVQACVYARGSACVGEGR